jgi:hypothetical protein
VERQRKLLGEPCIHQVEAVSELDQGTDDRGRLDLAPYLLIVREPQRPIGAEFPEVDASPSQS